MIVAVSTLYGLGRKLGDVVEEIVSLGVKHIEVVDDGMHSLDRRKVRMLREYASTWGLEYYVHAPFSDVNIASPNKLSRRASLRRVSRSLRNAGELECRVWVFHPGHYTPLEEFTPGTGWRENIRSVRKVVELAEDLGVTPALENVPEPFPFVLKSVRDFRRFYEESGIEVGIALDVGHSNIIGENLAFVREFGDRIVHVHAHDNMGDWDTHLEVGKGTVDWHSFLSALRDVGYSGAVSVESTSGVGESVRYILRLLESL